MHGGYSRRMVILTRVWTLIALTMMTMYRGRCTVAEGPVLSTAVTTNGGGSSSALSCEVARMKCAYRVGCGMALQNYMVGCSDIMSGRIRRCSDLCKKSLIALTSTEEGQELMVCDCQGQEFCELSKQRVEVCRPDVVRANAADTVVSCSVAQWICAADPLCSTALEYYRRLCRSMFHGKKCTMRCNNSISILNRQQKAAKLRTCICDGTEDYDCGTIRMNMDRLCFHKGNNDHHEHHRDEHHNEIQGDSPGSVAASASQPTAACSYSTASTTILVVLAAFLTLIVRQISIQTSSIRN